MKFEIIHDFVQYDGVLLPIEDELERRGWKVIKTRVATYGKDKSVKGTLGCQTGPWIPKKPPINPSFLIFHGVSFIKNWARQYSTWDYVIVPSEFWKTHLSHDGFAKPLGLGWSKSDVLINESEKRDFYRDMIRSRHKLDNRPIIAFAPTYSKSGGKQKPGSAKHLMKLSKVLSDYNLVFIPHVMCEFKNKYNDYQPRVSHDYQKKHEYLLGADMLISDTSSMVFEFSLLDKPIITLNDPSNPKYMNIQGMDERVDIGRIVDFNNFNILPQIVAEELATPSLHHERRKYWNEKCLGYCDGNSTVRIVDKIEEICG